ncbi:kinase-like domain-containing protein [Rhizophagus irregularis DAOM 181602=DAOM 197198]|uniref:Protein kinase domain-containing protein n=1 Tax=Rhizophagus irregularis (strain DAOM 181602 / DAOM 197198 / MUCL 43194) TaxID=747089 RepID=A0A2P4PE87_RHIID|nr:hypothetical protein GLOIN_2v1783816 [Rhizophagus irregularis DAOM 181602=DAOM 197198]POG63681.1 hypothetical protein GLOIN_2v1783816 [Rhizophagus irregularis DAOM 181602=DAOM 197198]GET60371.1 kinase-like domain-containing protein [Rhizophagus irregularis DAOM 181602=DAOM 197198]|eukprot:XP_025170547.1 hypothetical protein GLOIN_2v1783816 [Rhizophagus irregularis DAOM 181602=DAOM 197198]
MAPEIFQGKKYIKASDIYSFGMIMWEFMTGRRPFWDQNHDTELIIDISDDKRSTATDVYTRIKKMCENERKSYVNKYPTKIIESSDIGPITTNNPGAIYRTLQKPMKSWLCSSHAAAT